MPSIIHGIGIHSMWGLSPNVNLIPRRSRLQQQQPIDKEEEEDATSILLLQPSDPRHILSTMAKFKPPSKIPPATTTTATTTTSQAQSQNNPNHPPSNLHIYVVETPMETMARHLLLLYIFLDWNIPIRQRATLYLEIFGNVCIQERSRTYLVKVAKLLIDFICHDCQEEEEEHSHETNGSCKEEKEEENNNVLDMLHSIVDLSFLKFKEKDDLESILQSWIVNDDTTTMPTPLKSTSSSSSSLLLLQSSSAKNDKYNLPELRDYRLRHYYGERYDHRKNLIDWDYQMQVKDVASIIHASQYQTWRMNGIAFEFGDATYNIPNVTLASVSEGFIQKGKDKGRKKPVKGYWSDIVVSPFIAWGVHVDDDDDDDDDDGGEDKENNEKAHVQSLFQIVNKGTGAEQQRHHSVEVSMFNVMSMMWEMQTGEKYKMHRKHDIFSGLGLGENNENAHGNNESEKNKDKYLELRKQTQRTQIKKNFKIVIIGQGLNSTSTKKRLKDKFDAVFLSHRAYPSMENARTILDPMMKTGASITMETGKYIFPIKKDEKCALIAKWKELGNEMGWKDMNHAKKDSLLSQNWLAYKKLK